MGSLRFDSQQKNTSLNGREPIIERPIVRDSNFPVRIGTAALLRFPSSYWLLITGFTFVSAVILYSLYRYLNLSQQFAWLAQSFLAGRTDIPEAWLLGPGGPGTHDFVLADGKYYWPLPPFPAVMLLPLISLFGLSHAQQVLQIWIVAAVALLAYAVAKRSGRDSLTAGWLSLALVGASVFTGTAVFYGSQQLASVIFVALGLGAVCEHLGRRRTWLLGLLTALAIATRFTGGLSLLLFFAIEIFFSDRPKRAEIIEAIRFGGPVVAMATALMAYNWTRFGSVFETGYLDSVSNYPGLVARRAATGLFHWSNVPRNFFYYFLAWPVWRGARLAVNTNGLSFFLISLPFVSIFLKRRLKPDEWAAAISSLAVIAILLFYYCTGFEQIGPRYLGDVLPLLYLLLVGAFRDRELGRFAKGTLLVGCGIN